jgi:hypothetical protein
VTRGKGHQMDLDELKSFLKRMIHTPRQDDIGRMESRLLTRGSESLNMARAGSQSRDEKG